MEYPIALRNFVDRFTNLIKGAAHDEQVILSIGSKLLADLIACDDWLSPECAKHHPQNYRQYLLYCDPYERFSVVSFVWGPGQLTPVHDHTVWALIGVLRGSERNEQFTLGLLGQPMNCLENKVTLRHGIEQVSPTIGDIHRVSNASLDQVSISIHVYGGNIGKIKRNVYDLETGAAKQFVSGYSISS